MPASEFRDSRSVSMSPFEITNSAGDKNFPTDRRPIRRPLIVEDLPTLEFLEAWREGIGLTIGPVADTPEKRRIAIGIFYNWRD